MKSNSSQNLANYLVDFKKWNWNCFSVSRTGCSINTPIELYGHLPNICINIHTIHTCIVCWICISKELVKLIFNTFRLLYCVCVFFLVFYFVSFRIWRNYFTLLIIHISSSLLSRDKQNQRKEKNRNSSFQIFNESCYTNAPAKQSRLTCVGFSKVGE